MRLVRLLTTTLACSTLASGCSLFYFQPIQYDLAASVVGVVDRSGIRSVVDDRFPDTAHFWLTNANEREQLLRVRLSTSKDLVAFSNRKHVLLGLVWRFCDNPRQPVYLGYVDVFVDAMSVPAIPRKPSPVVRDRDRRFAYDAILFVRDTRPDEGYAGYDLERDPQDVCVWAELPNKPGGYKTNMARIPKEAIAAELNVGTPLR